MIKRLISSINEKTDKKLLALDRFLVSLGKRLLSAGKKLLRIYEVGQVWEYAFCGKATIIEVGPSVLVLQNEMGKTYMTKGFANLCLK